MATFINKYNKYKMEDALKLHSGTFRLG